MKAKVAVVGLGVLMSTAGFGAVTNANAALVSIPAPPAVSEAVAVEVGDLVSVGQSGAGASEAGAGASAAPIKVGGEPLLTGTKATTSSASDSLLDTGETELGRVTVMPWSTDVNGTQASASSAIAMARLNGIGSVTLAPSSSFASWTPGQSNSAAVSDGAIITLGDFTIKVLHAQSNSSGKGRTYLVQILGRDIGATNAQGCLVDVGALAAVGCLEALSGTAAESAVAQALLDAAPIANNPFGKVVAASASGGVGSTSNVLGTETSRGPVGTLLARTGMNALSILALGLLMIVGGLTAIHASRRTAPAEVTLR